MSAITGANSAKRSHLLKGAFLAIVCAPLPDVVVELGEEALVVGIIVGLGEEALVVGIIVGLGEEALVVGIIVEFGEETLVVDAAGMLVEVEIMTADEEGLNNSTRLFLRVEQPNAAEEIRFVGRSSRFGMQLPARSVRIVECFHVNPLNRAVSITSQNVNAICSGNIFALKSTFYLRMHLVGRNREIFEVRAWVLGFL